jgi:hypothetical protein
MYYPAPGKTSGALILLNPHGKTVLDSLTAERLGRLLVVFVNERPVTKLKIDKRVTNGQLDIPSGLTGGDIASMKRCWAMIPKKNN